MMLQKQEIHDFLCIKWSIDQVHSFSAVLKYYLSNDDFFSVFSLITNNFTY